jgi:hypothetical protein
MTEPSITYGHGKLYDFEEGFLFKDATTYTATADGGFPDIWTICASLTQADDYWNGVFIKILSATNDIVGETREVNDFGAGSDVLEHDAFSDDTLTGDTFQLSAWKIVEDGQTLDTPTCENGDILALTASGTGGNADGYLQNFTDIDISTAIYTKIYWRYKCSNATVKAQIVVEFSDTNTQTVLSEANSTSWTTGSATLTTSKTLDHIRLHANADTGTVYYDYVLVCKGAFTFPNAESITVVPSSDLIRTAYPARVGRAPQTMGADDTKILMTCDLDSGTWTRTADTIAGEVFYEINHEGSINEEWQLLTTGHGQELKVRLETPQFTYGNDRHLLALTFYEYRLGGAQEESYAERYGI